MSKNLWFVFHHTLYKAFHMHPDTCYGLGLPDTTGRHLWSARKICQKHSTCIAQSSTRKPWSTMMAIPGQKGREFQTSHNLFVIDVASIQWRDECDCPMKSNSKQPFESTVGLLCREHFTSLHSYWTLLADTPLFSPLVSRSWQNIGQCIKLFDIVIIQLMGEL